MSLLEMLFAEAKVTSAHGSIDIINYRLGYLEGCTLIKPDDDEIHVARHGSKEMRMWIESDDGEVIALHEETSRSLNDRTERNAKRPASAGVDGSATQKQRIH